MAEIGYASLGIIPSFDGFGSKLERGTRGEMAAAGAIGGRTFGDEAGKAAGSRFKSRMKSAAKVAGAGLAIGAAAAFKFAGDSLDEARDAQKVGALTRSTIKATGGAAKVTAKQVERLSGAISDKVGIDDEAIQSGANMLLTFKNIRNEAGKGGKVFDQSLRTLVDLSSAMGTDAKSSAIQLGKALNDPIKGVTALSRVGVTFTDQQKKQIEALVEAGDTMSAQKIILRELKSEFGGAAAAQATEADKLSVSWGNFKEEIGTELIPVMDDLAVFLRKKGIPAAKDFSDWVRDKGIPAAKDFADDIEPVVNFAKDLAGYLNDLPKSVKIGGLAALAGGIGASKLRGGGGGALGTAGKILGVAKGTPVYVTNWAQIAAGDGIGGGPGKSKIPYMGLTVTTAAITAGNIASIEANKGNGVELGATAPAAAGGGLNLPKYALDFSEDVDKTTAAIVRANDAASKLPNKIDLGKTSAQALASEVFEVDRGIKRVEGRKETRFVAPGFDELLRKTRDYYGLLDGLDGRTIETFIRTTQQNNDTGEGGGGRVPGRSGGVTVIHNGNIVSNSPRDYAKDAQRRSRLAAGGGVNFP